jgi:hypothetical protein
MARLLILYRHPVDTAAFEDYYANRHIPYAAKHMPNVRGAENMRVISTADGSPAPYYRVTAELRQHGGPTGRDRFRRRAVHHRRPRQLRHRRSDPADHGRRPGRLSGRQDLVNPRSRFSGSRMCRLRAGSPGYRPPGMGAGCRPVAHFRPAWAGYRPPGENRDCPGACGWPASRGSTRRTGLRPSASTFRYQFTDRVPQGR